MKKLWIFISIIIIVLAGCSIGLKRVPNSCSSEYDFSTAKISNMNLEPEKQYVAKKGNYLFFSDVAGNGKGQTEIRVDITQRKITKSEIKDGKKVSQTFEKGDDGYKNLVYEIVNLSTQYLEEAMIVEGYDKENTVVVDKYNECLSKIK